uniref:Uncharacterized protein n=1 Tax=Anopheles farauti TaxID=69004 RepID=A0A182QYP5_9DIPT
MTNLCVYVGLLLSLLVATGEAHLNLYLNEIEVQRLLVRCQRARVPALDHERRSLAGIVRQEVPPKPIVKTVSALGSPCKTDLFSPPIVQEIKRETTQKDNVRCRDFTRQYQMSLQLT